MELTCWWNQLWIIFMNMKSITAAAQSNSSIPSICSLEWADWLRIDWIWRALRHWFDGNSFLWDGMKWNPTKKWNVGWFWFLFGWVMGRNAPNAPQRGNKQPNQPINSMNEQRKIKSSKQRNERILEFLNGVGAAFDLFFVNGAPSSPAARQAKQQTQFLFFMKKWNVFVERRRERRQMNSIK